MPKARLQIVDSSFNAIYPQLRNRDLDFAICPLSSAANGRDIDSTALFSSAMTPVCVPQHPLSRVSSLKELMGEIWTWAEDGDGGVVSDAFRYNNLEKPFAVVSDSFSSRLQLIIACNAVALFPTILLESTLLKGRIVPIGVRERIPEARYYLVRSAYSPLTTQAELLAELFKEQAARIRGMEGRWAAP
jgi:DNA-binding transcriptional LysR family regulator